MQKARVRVLTVRSDDLDFVQRIEDRLTGREEGVFTLGENSASLPDTL